MLDRLCADLRDECEMLQESGALRQRPVIDSPNGRVVIVGGGYGKRTKLHNWASNDYLAATSSIRVKNAARRALRQYGTGAGSARLLSGGLRCHKRLEERLTHWLQPDIEHHYDTVIGPTGFQTNMAVLVSLADHKNDVIILDRLCHASMYDGARLAAGSLTRFRHNDSEDLRTQLARASTARRKIVCIESIYSMDGDEADLQQLRAVCDEMGAILLVDEAHALGVLGPAGRGLCAEQSIRPDLIMGTCSKSLGAQGGFACGRSEIIEWIVNRGRSLIYSTALSPASCGAAIEVLNLLRDRPDMGRPLAASSVRIRTALREQGWSVPEGRSPIIPVVVGDQQRAVALSAALRERGHFAPAIRPPTVPPRECRLRISLTLAHTESDIQRFLRIMADLYGKKP